MDINQFKAACDKSLAHLKKAFMHLQVGRASSGLVEELHVYVASRGQNQKLNQIANITTMDAQTLKIEPWDKNVLADIEKAIYDADIGLTPLNQGEYILIKVPPMTEERRKELTKVVNREGEDAKIAIRNHRQDARKTLDHALKDEEISENEKNSKEKQIDQISSDYNDQIDKMVEAKNKEIMTI